MMGQGDITVTVVLYNSDDLIESCLDSIASAATRGVASVIAVDNCSPDDSVKVIRASFPWVRIINAEINGGFAKGCNLAWNEVNGPYWLLLNPDASFISETGLEELVEWMNEHSDVGVASPDIVDNEGTSNFPARRFPSILRLYLESSRLHKLLPTKWRARLLMGIYASPQDTVDADWVPGTAMIVRTTAVKEVGLLSEDFFMYGEDIEWCWRFRKHGWKVGYCSEVSVRHGDSTSSVKSWGGEEKERRMIHGIFEAVKRMNGKVYAFALWASLAMLARIESLNPSLNHQEKRRCRQLATCYFTMVRDEIST